VEKQIKIEIKNGNYVVTKVKPLITSALGSVPKDNGSVLNDAIRLAVELETFNRAERRVTEGRSYLRTTAADSTAGKVSDKTKYCWQGI
jgi:hypothetical protein